MASLALVLVAVVCILFIALFLYLLVVILDRKLRNFERIMVLVGLLVAASASYFTFVSAFVDLS